MRTVICCRPSLTPTLRPEPIRLPPRIVCGQTLTLFSYPIRRCSIATYFNPVVADTPLQIFKRSFLKLSRETLAIDLRQLSPQSLWQLAIAQGACPLGRETLRWPRPPGVLRQSFARVVRVLLLLRAVVSLALVEKECRFAARKVFPHRTP